MDALAAQPFPFGDYLVYVDESGDHELTKIDPQYPVFVLLFCIIHKDDYLTRVCPDLQRFNSSSGVMTKWCSTSTKSESPTATFSSCSNARSENASSPA